MRRVLARWSGDVFVFVFLQMDDCIPSEMTIEFYLLDSSSFGFFPILHIEIDCRTENTTNVLFVGWLC